MHVAITGATGNIGTALVERLGADEAIDSIVAICRREHDWRPPKTSWIYADVADDDLTEAFDGADAVVHLARVFHRAIRTRPGGSMWAAPRRCFARSAAQVPAVVVASSVGAYSPRTGPDPVDESWPTHGCHAAAYSREKAYVERLLDSHQSEFPHRRVVRMRPGFGNTNGSPQPRNGGSSWGRWCRVGWCPVACGRPRSFPFLAGCNFNWCTVPTLQVPTRRPCAGQSTARSTSPQTATHGY